MEMDAFHKLNELLGFPKHEPPKIDMLVKTEDEELAAALLALNIEGVSITPAVKQDAGISQDIVIVITYATALLGAITAVLNLVKAYKDNKPNKTETVIYEREHSIGIEDIAIKYKESIHIEIRHEK